jgi:predicted alpha-1,2-mannosidase
MRAPRGLLLLLLPACTPDVLPQASVDPVAAVDPFIASGGPGFRVGSGTPAATVPFGMVKVGPDTSLDWGGLAAYHCSGYYYDDDHIDGFSHFHLYGVGIADYGDILFMPTDGWDPSKTGEDGYKQSFQHDNEWAEPGSYGVTLDDGIEVELAATRHGAQHRYTFPTDSDPVVLIDLQHQLYGQNLGGEVSIDAEAGTVQGYMTNAGGFTGAGFPIWFYARFDEGIADFGTWADDTGEEGRAEASGIDLGAWIVPTSGNVNIRVGISLVSQEGARANFEAELGPRDIDGTAGLAEDAWEDALGVVDVVDPGTELQRTLFYTALYHVLQMPQEHGDADGKYPGFDGAIHTAEGWTYHDDFSLWDTYRTANPLYDLLYPEKARDFAQSLTRMAVEGGAFPRWPAAAGDSTCMLGAPQDIVLADSWVKGVTDWDIQDAWPILRDQEMGIGDIPYNARPDVGYLDTYGYYPADLVGASVAWTQEGAWADHAMAQLAVARGELDDAAHFEYRSHAWKNVYDPAVGFFHARYSDGSFADDFSDTAWGDEYTEGNAWQYLWLAPQHADELAEVLGGRLAARAKLDTFFDEARKEGVLDFPQTYYWHGNEPDIHAAWLYTLWGDRDSTWKWVRWIAENLYKDTDDGLAGNDDAGTLSAWYVFAGLGFYPIAGTPSYVAGVPLLREANFAVPGGTFTVRRIGDGDHVVAVRLNGVELTGATFVHSALIAGGSYEVEVQ